MSETDQTGETDQTDQTFQTDETHQPEPAGGSRPGDGPGADAVEEDRADGRGVAEDDESPGRQADRRAGDVTDGDQSLAARLEREGDVAADYLEELLDIADLDGDLDMDVDCDRAAVSIVGADLSQLVGERGEVLDALQELTRLAVYRETGERSRLMLDISGYRATQR